MAKLIFLLATAFAALLLVDASIYRATVVIEDDKRQQGQGQGQDCRQQFEQQQKLRNCQEFLHTSQQPGKEARKEERQQLQGCCDQLSNMESQCRCDAIEFALGEMQQGGQESQRMQQVMKVAQQIPSMCQMSPERCQFGQRSVY